MHDTFTNHQTGALPCMPARHDLLCGTLDFLWRPWGSVELWDTPITRLVRGEGVTTMLVSDHPHLFEAGGENYHTDFGAWDYTRGHEGDPCRRCRAPVKRMVQQGRSTFFCPACQPATAAAEQATT